jgi:hypothetical protein
MRRRPDLTVSMTTIPSRLPLLSTVLEHILSQSCSDFDLRLYLPEFCERTHERYELPNYLTEYGHKLKICTTSRDYGPATKLLGPLETIEAKPGEERGSVITIDDDVLLEPHAIEELATARARYPREVLGFMGVSAGHFIHAETLAANGLCERTVGVLGGYRGILYPLDVVDQSLLDDYDAVTDRCRPFLDDDHLFAWNLARRGVPRRVISTSHPGPDSGLNIQLLDLPDAITFGPDSGAAVQQSHHCLIDYYQSRGWAYPT